MRDWSFCFVVGLLVFISLVDAQVEQSPLGAQMQAEMTNAERIAALRSFMIPMLVEVRLVGFEGDSMISESELMYHLSLLPRFVRAAATDVKVCSSS